MWAELDQLRHRWAAKAGVQGGVYALAGFNFQLAASLLALIRSAVAERRPNLLIEALSDLVTEEDGYLVVCQAKLSLRHAALRDALEELWQVDELARREVPAVAPRLRYRVLTSRMFIRDGTRALENWRSESADVAVAAFRARVELRTEPHPAEAIAEHLANALGDPDPFGTTDRWLGRLLGEPSSQGFESSVRQILTELRGLEAAAIERTHRFHIWGDQDRPPSAILFEADPGRATLIGQMPRRQHLMEGRFARRWFYDDLHRRAEAWLNDAEQVPDTRLPVFWLAGRSGTGKSVALLHLLADLRLEDSSRTIIWLDDQADRLVDAARWARPFFAAGRQVIFASDDPFSPERHQRVSAAVADLAREWDSISLAHPDALRPMMVVCGPVEQSQAFEDDLADRTCVEQFLVPREGARDVAELRTWYSARTGKRDLPVEDAEGLLLVQLFFEWATGEPIREFSLRFRQRLQGLTQDGGSSSIFQLVAEILALNRLYALYPTAVLRNTLDRDPDLARAFDALARSDGHFSFDEDAGGLRLTHPHLADAIYGTWFGRDQDRFHRRAHLSATLWNALRQPSGPSQRLAPLWGIARLSGPLILQAPELKGRIGLIEAELKELLAEIYQASFMGSTSPLTDLPVWTDLDANLDLGLSPSPLLSIAEACEGIQATVPGLRLSCHKLLQHLDRQPSNGQIVARILQRFPFWNEWPAVAVDYIKRLGPLRIAETLGKVLPRLTSRSARVSLIEGCLQSGEAVTRPIVLSWLDTTARDDPYWPFALNAVFEIWGLSARTRALAWDFLRLAPDDSAWSHVWEHLFDVSKPADQAALVEMARRWLDRRDFAISGWDRIWERLWELANRNDQQIWDLGIEYLASVPHHSSCAFVWQTLARGPLHSARTLRAGREWLALTLDHKGWTFVWADVWARTVEAQQTRGSKTTSAHLDDLHDTACQWLARSFGHDSWSFVWADLFRERPASQPLRDLAGQWLLDQPIDNGWLVVWRAVEGNLEFLRTRFVRMPAEHQSWGFAWRQVFDAHPFPDEPLLRLALDWLPGHLDQDGWTFVWTAAWHASSTKDPALRELGWTWIRGAANEEPGWSFVWSDLWDSRGADTAELEQFALNWLVCVEHSHAGWAHVWQQLWTTTDVNGHPLLGMAMRWLGRADPHHQGWPLIWERVWTEDPSEDIKVMGLQRLATAAPDHPHWGQVWGPLANSPIDPHLRTLGINWLDVAPHHHGNWSNVWERLWNASGGTDSDLLIRGRAWLLDGPDERPGWPFVWRALWIGSRWDSADRDKLRAAADTWLQGKGPTMARWSIIWTIFRDERLLAPGLLSALATRLQQNAPPRETSDSPDEFGSSPTTTIVSTSWQWTDSWMSLWSDAGEADNAQRRSELFADAKAHLARFDLQQRGWTTIWRALWQYAVEDPAERTALSALALEWLGVVEAAHPRWSEVWTALWHAAPDARASLASQARTWLVAQPIVDWPSVWLTLWTEGARDEFLTELARGRLLELEPAKRARVEAQLSGQASSSA